MGKRNSPGCTTNPCCGCTFTPRAYQCIGGTTGVFAGNAGAGVPAVGGVAITLKQGTAVVASGTTDATGQAAIAVSGGTYTMTGTDPYGNTASGSITLTCPSPGAFFVALPATTGVACCTQFCSGTPIPTTLSLTSTFGTTSLTYSGNWVGYQTVTVPGIDLNTCADATVTTLIRYILSCSSGSSSTGCPFLLAVAYEQVLTCGGVSMTTKPVAFAGPATLSFPTASGTTAAGSYTYGQRTFTYGSVSSPASKSPLAIAFAPLPTVAFNLGTVTVTA
jgi:hypothetical protein